MIGTTICGLWIRLLRDTFASPLSDEDGFLVFVLFHTHRIVLVESVLLDRPGISEVCADTQRGVASSIAAIWAGIDEDRSDYRYWYHRWNGEWRGYEHAENLSEDEKTRFEHLKQKIANHPFVIRFEQED